MSVSVMPARSSSRYRSVLFLATREISSDTTIPAWPSSNLRGRLREPRPVVLAPDTPWSSSITWIPERGQPNDGARATRSY
jgi:hypothetical protein